MSDNSASRRRPHPTPGSERTDAGVDHSTPFRADGAKWNAGHQRTLAAVLLFVFMAAVYFGSPIVRVGDSKYLLLISEHILHAGNLAVDEHFWPYVDSSDYPKVNPGEYYPRHVRRVGGHLYPFYGPGAPILSVPFVAAMKWLFNESVFDARGRYLFEIEKQWQKRLAAVATAAACVLFFLTAHLLLSTRLSLLIAVSGGLGTQLWSTASRAASAQMFTVLLLSLALFLILRSEATPRSVCPVLLGTLLSWCFFVRPTAAMFIAPLTLYLVLRDRNRGVWLVMTGVTWLGLFVWFSLRTFGTVLPGYYLAGDELSLHNLAVGLPGQLISPSRGFFVFVPAVLFVFYLVVRWKSSGLPVVNQTTKEKTRFWEKRFGNQNHKPRRQRVVRSWHDESLSAVQSVDSRCRRCLSLL